MKIFVKCAQIGDAHLQRVNNHYANLKYKGKKIISLTDYINLTPHLHYGWEKTSKYATHKNEKTFI